MKKMIDLKKYHNYLSNEGKSQNTVDGYVRDIKLYMGWFEKTYFKKCSKLMRENIIQYKLYLKEEKKDAAKTINHKISSLKKLNDYLIMNRIQSELVIKDSDYVKIQKSFLSPMRFTIDEILEFIQYVLEQENSRNYAIVILFAYTGLRISELVSVELRDFNLETSELIVRNGKGEKQRIVILNDKVLRALKNYLDKRDNYKNAGESKYLFLSQKGNQLHRSSINRIFNSYPYDLTPHDLRHFFCTNGLDKGLTLIELKEIAGHESLQTTQQYLHPDKRKFKDKMNQL